MFHTMLVCSDGSDQAIQAARYAARLALKLQAKIILLHVFDDSNPPLMHEDLKHYAARVHHAVERRTGAVFTEAGVAFETIHELGDEVNTILAVAAQRKADLIVLGDRGLSQWEALLLGSVSDGVLHYGSVPLLIVRGEHTGFQKILLATDGTSDALKATQAAIQLTKEFGSDLTALSVYEPVRLHRNDPTDALNSDSYLWRFRATVMASVEVAAEKEGVAFAFEQIVGKAAEVIVRVADESNADLIVLGSGGVSTLRNRLLGSVSKQVAHHASCPILITR